ncbi:LD-carboxypeptidase [Amycolatopsis sp. SB7-3]|uniref:S66 peptidase family protein n=1 Tax=Amycolatopsis sp. SB7-3 TaxID=3373438 RepID=UPI0037428528
MTAPPSTLIAPKPRPGDHVRLVSPASFPSRELVAETKAVLESWGLVVEIGKHALDQRGFLAGRDEDRLDDAFRDPAVRAVIATRGGAGAYRIADDLDFAAVLADPKPVIGFSDITALHLALRRHCGLAGIHGFLAGSRSATATRRLLMDGEPAVLHRDSRAMTVAAEVPGTAAGDLIGGNLGTIAHAVGVGLPSLSGALLFLEAERTMGLGQIDRQLTQLIRSGALDGVHGIALGRFPGFEGFTDRGWTLVDVFKDRLGSLNVPVLGGIDVGHGPDPLSLPLGTAAVLDTETGTLTVEPAVR